MSKVLENLKYAKSHEWVKVEGNIAYVGITAYAQESLGSIVYIETLEVDEEVNQFSELGAVESVKAASDIYAPVSGKIIEVNQEVIDSPELVNQDSYASWLVKIEMNDLNELDNLLDAASYSKLA